jgi:hypothetical protein
MVKVLIVLVLLLVLALLIILLQLSGKLGKISLDQKAVKRALDTCWKEPGIDQDIGAMRANVKRSKKFIREKRDLLFINKKEVI